jgi:hypothetical protein
MRRASISRPVGSRLLRLEGVVGSMGSVKGGIGGASSCWACAFSPLPVFERCGDNTTQGTQNAFNRSKGAISTAWGVSNSITFTPIRFGLVDHVGCSLFRKPIRSDGTLVYELKFDRRVFAAN